MAAISSRRGAPSGTRSRWRRAPGASRAPCTSSRNRTRGSSERAPAKSAAEGSGPPDEASGLVEHWRLDAEQVEDRVENVRLTVFLSHDDRDRHRGLHDQ